MAKPVEISEQTFEAQVLQSTLPVLVDFWAPWCGPCKMVAPVVEELAGEYEDKVRFAKINTDENTDLAMRFRVMSIPTLIVFKGGQEVSRVIGFRPKRELAKELEKALAR